LSRINFLLKKKILYEKHISLPLSRSENEGLFFAKKLR